MQKFTDASGQVWQINITTRDIMRVRQETGFDLGHLFDDGLQILATLADDVVKLVDVIWSAIGSNVPTDRVRFDNSMTGDAIEAGMNCLIEAVIDFFPNPKRREACRAALRKMWEALEIRTNIGLEKINSFDPTSLLSATDSAASSASTPQDSRSGN